jgi:hypothetical protein
MNRIPDNEFSEQFTGDFGRNQGDAGSDDVMLYYMLNPSICDFPEGAEYQRQWWKNGCPTIKRGTHG